MLHVRTSGLVLAIAAAVTPFAAACSSPTPEPVSTTSAAASVATPAAPPNEPTLRFVQSNGIRMRVAEMGKGPLVILLHGFPESWYRGGISSRLSPRLAIDVVAPDLRGYGKSDKPAAVEDYDIHKLTADIVGLYRRARREDLHPDRTRLGGRHRLAQPAPAPRAVHGPGGDERAIRRPPGVLAAGDAPRSSQATISITPCIFRSPASLKKNSTQIRADSSAGSISPPIRRVSLRRSPTASELPEGGFRGWARPRDCPIG